MVYHHYLVRRKWFAYINALAAASDNKHFSRDFLPQFPRFFYQLRNHVDMKIITGSRFAFHDDDLDNFSLQSRLKKVERDDGVLPQWLDCAIRESVCKNGIFELVKNIDV